MKVSLADQFDQLKRSGKIKAHEPLSLDTCRALGKDVVPDAYLKFLQTSNGAETGDGYFRLFGIGDDAKIDALAWNNLNTWKFSWPERVKDYWCFGETAWGDQYSFKTTDENSKIYILRYLTMMPEHLEENFDDFLNNEFFRNATAPYDPIILAAKKRFRLLNCEVILAQSPLVLLSGVEDIEKVMKMPRTAAMIVNGDLCSQLIDQPQSDSVKGLEPLQDSKGRMRLKVIWDTAS